MELHGSQTAEVMGRDRETLEDFGKEIFFDQT